MKHNQFGNRREVRSLSLIHSFLRHLCGCGLCLRSHVSLKSDFIWLFSFTKKFLYSLIYIYGNLYKRLGGAARYRARVIFS